MAKKLSKLTSAFISMAAAALLTPSLASAAIVTFQNLSVSGDVPIEQFEDGMRYALSRPFSVRDFRGNPPSALIGSPIFIDTPFDRPTVFTTASFRDFTFDGYDLASFGPPQQSDTWLFRGMLGSSEQFSFSDSTTGPFLTRMTNRSDPIDRLEIWVTAGSSAAMVADNLRFSIVDNVTPIPEPGSAAMLALGLSLLVVSRMRGRR